MKLYYRLCRHGQATLSMRAWSEVIEFWTLARKGPIMNRRDVLALSLTTLAGMALAPPAAFAQGRYPDRPVRLVIPFPPGGIYDAVGRPWAERVKALLGTIVVENQGGAGSSLGAAAVARAQPDGYTILLGGISALVINPVAASRPPYDPIKDFEPISILGFSSSTFVVHPSLPVRDLKELIAYAKANPGKLSYGSSGVGSINHLSGELLKSLSGIDIPHVPYRGAGPAMTDLIGGQIQVNVQSVSGQVIELHRGGKLRMLAVTSPVRLEASPDIPTAVESGLPTLIAQQFIGLFAPRGTPKAIIDQIAEATHKALAVRELQQLFITSGFEPALDTGPEQTRRVVADEIVRWTPLIKSIGLKLD
jgi:tripartite-type tricarboxylate transporter receptor subunit TctC